MNTNLANFSTDLLRISNWIYSGNDEIANKFIDICISSYPRENVYTGVLGNLEKQLIKMKDSTGDRYVRADTASTLSRIIFFQSLMES